MPIYEYKCAGCGDVFEVLQRYSDPAPQKHEQCGSTAVRRVLSAAAFIFKGDGWYVTDYARKDKDKSADKKGGGSEPPASSSSSGSGTAAGTSSSSSGSGTAAGTSSSSSGSGAAAGTSSSSSGSGAAAGKISSSKNAAA